PGRRGARSSRRGRATGRPATSRDRLVRSHARSGQAARRYAPPARKRGLARKNPATNATSWLLAAARRGRASSQVTYPKEISVKIQHHRKLKLALQNIKALATKTEELAPAWSHTPTCPG